MDAPAAHVAKDNLRRGEQQRVNLVKILVLGEQLGEERSELRRGTGRHLRAELGQLVVVRIDEYRRPPAVEDGVVGAADGGEVVGSGWRERGERDARFHLAQVELEF